MVATAYDRAFYAQLVTDLTDMLSVIKLTMNGNDNVSKSKLHTSPVGTGRLKISKTLSEI